MKPAGSGYVKGDRVRLLHLSEDFLQGIDPDDVVRLRTLIGRRWTVEVVRAEFGVIEIVFKHPRGAATPLEWVSVPPEWIERYENG